MRDAGGGGRDAAGCGALAQGWVAFRSGLQKQIPRGNDRKKGKDNALVEMTIWLAVRKISATRSCTEVARNTVGGIAFI